MFTRNYHLWVSKAILNSPTTSFGGLYNMESDGEYEPVSLYRANGWDVYAGPTDRKYGIYLMVGSGSTSPKKSDYKLEDQVELFLVDGSVSDTNEQTTKTVSATLKNTTESVITIREVGVAIHGYNNEYMRSALLGRIVLDTPVVLQPEDTYTFTYVIQ